MEKPKITYDERSDTLYVSFESGTKATGIELNFNRLIHSNKHKRKAVGVTFFEYSLLAQKTDLGPRSFPLTGLSELSGDLRQTVLNILLTPPVSEILSVSAFTPSVVETIPITLLRPLTLSAA